MTDLEAHVNAEGRDKLVKQVREKINELGVTYIYYQFIICFNVSFTKPQMSMSCCPNLIPIKNLYRNVTFLKAN